MMLRLILFKDDGTQVASIDKKVPQAKIEKEQPLPPPIKDPMEAVRRLFINEINQWRLPARMLHLRLEELVDAVTEIAGEDNLAEMGALIRMLNLQPAIATLREILMMNEYDRTPFDAQRKDLLKEYHVRRDRFAANAARRGPS